MFEEKRFHSGGRSAVYYTLIKFLNGIIPCVPSLHTFRSLVSALRKREGFGGEKAATSAASLPVPTNPNISLISRKLSRLCQCSAGGKSEQKREVVFRRKAGRQLHVFADLFSAVDRPRLCTAPPRTRHRHLAGRGPAAKALVAPTGAKSSVGDYPAAVLR